jgi:hypothetical protein
MIFNEMEVKDREYWFDFKQKKFLHNIDTFYYSVKFHNDFTADTQDVHVKKLRSFFQKKKDLLDSNAVIDFLQLNFNGKYLNLKKYSFAHMYSICLECPEWFDLFIAPSVPRGSDGGESMTCEFVVQIRSCLLWMYGVHNAFERSYEYVQALADYFHLEIAFAQENRIDFCWHTNYLSNPEQFFALDNFYKMRVDRFDDALTHTEKVGSSGYEVDYVALGKRSDKVFIRIYLKCKEVIEQAYKGWFLYTWLFHGLINRYDLYVFEECYKRKSWKYLNMARINYYLDYGQDPEQLETCRKLINNEITMEEDTLQALADLLTPKVNLVMNIEYQTMRRHTKSYQLVPFKDNSARGSAQRIYDYLDNRKLVADYLTYYVFRLVTPEGDVNKSRRDLCGFWKSLRSCKMVDVLIPPKQLRLIREYNNKLNAELVKTRAINSVVTYGFYNKGINDDDIMQDVVDALCRMNDNDMQKAIRYKRKKAQQLNSRELVGFLNDDASAFSFDLVDTESGVYYSHNNTPAENLQEVNKNENN